MSGRDKTEVTIDFKTGDKEIPKDSEGTAPMASAEKDDDASAPPSDDEVDNKNHDEEEQPRKKNYYVAARGHVQRVVDVALLISNMSRLATITKMSDSYTQAQLIILSIALVLSMIAQIIAGICFFVCHQREINQRPPNQALDYTAYGCVGAVMVLNVFIATFHATWTGQAPAPAPTPPTHLTST